MAPSAAISFSLDFSIIDPSAGQKTTEVAEK
jgi:hypothetical protein